MNMWKEIIILITFWILYSALWNTSPYLLSESLMKVGRFFNPYLAGVLQPLSFFATFKCSTFS